ncbi:hypothetical protein CLOM_g5798 [Closterium sp. NIES-68]|nr:hypothetical protein CLOM_g5798 [Closterium sp. NIES-68]GJP73854.1 hypothetical protein CLOP_g4530 [Closterium sp. NIES-67]
MCPGGANAGLPIHSLLFNNSLFEDLDAAATAARWLDSTAASGASAACSATSAAPPKFSAGGWSRLTQALSSSRAPTPTQKKWDAKRDGKRAARTSKAAAPSAAAKPPSASRPQLVEKDGDSPEPALLLLPDGSVQIVTCASKFPTARSPKKATNSAESSGVTSMRVVNDASPRPTHASDVLRDHPVGYQVGLLTSSNAVLRPQQVIKPGHVYFLQPPLADAALPAPGVNGMNPADDFGASRDESDEGDSAALLAVQRDDSTNADNVASENYLEPEEHPLDDVTITEEGLVASILGNSYRISDANVVTRDLSYNGTSSTTSSTRSNGSNTTMRRSASSGESTQSRAAFSATSSAVSSATTSAATSENCSPALLPAAAPGQQPPLLSLSPFPMPSLYRTPCACCSGKRSTTPTSHFSRALTHSLTLSPTSSAAAHSTFPSPMLSPRGPPTPPSPSPSLPCPIGASGSSRPRAAAQFSAVPEDFSYELDVAAAQMFAAAAQELPSSPLMHRGWCTAGRHIHPQYSPGIGCSECDSDSGGPLRSYSARYDGIRLSMSTGFGHVSSSSSNIWNNVNHVSNVNNGNTSSISSMHRRSQSRGLESFSAAQSEVDAFDRGQVQRHSPFRVRGRAVVTVEDMVFGRGETSLA